MKKHTLQKVLKNVKELKKFKYNFEPLIFQDFHSFTFGLPRFLKLWVFLFYFIMKYEIYQMFVILFLMQNQTMSFIVIAGANFLFSIPFHWSSRNHRKHSISWAGSCQMDRHIRTLRYAVSWLELRYPAYHSVCLVFNTWGDILPRNHDLSPKGLFFPISGRTEIAP